MTQLPGSVKNLKTDFKWFLCQRVWVMVFVHEKEIDAQNARMSGLNQNKEENVRVVSNLTSVCVSYFDFFLALTKEHSIFVLLCESILYKSS